VPKKASSACKHCHNAVNHHSHPEKAEKHLNNCEKFTKKVYGEEFRETTVVCGPQARKGTTTDSVGCC